jgi:DNA-binding NarL/FixJ family response regulator
MLAALRELRGVERPRLRAEVHLALAEARSADRPAATAEARAALALFVRLGARRDADRAAALLRSLGVTVRAAAGGHEVLSRREREVVPLVAEGLSNAEIARRLFVTPKTVEHHVTSILGKLGLRTRAEVAAWAVRHTTA